MRLIFVAGPPRCGKTSLLLHTLGIVNSCGLKPCVFKLDAQSTTDMRLFEEKGFAVMCRVSGDVCPDHEAMVALGESWEWAKSHNMDMLVVETAGLCDRCSPFLARALAVCVVSGLGGLDAPVKMANLVSKADVLVVSRVELISPAERQVIIGRLRRLNKEAPILVSNGLTGEGAEELAKLFIAAAPLSLRDQERLRSPLPTGYCHFCQGTESGNV